MTDPREQSEAHATLPDRVVRAPRRLFFGGSFDPPHLGHASLPAQVARRIGDDADAGADVPIVYVPAARSPHKDQAPAPDADRLAMLGLALRDLDHPSAVWTYELDASDPGAPSYWADTWARVRAACGLDGNRFLIGADQALSMHRWRRFDEFWRDAVVMGRNDADSGATLVEGLRELGVWSEDDLAHWAGRVVPIGMIDASSTRIRAALADPQTRTHPIAGLDDRVRSYIVSRGLYTRAE